jgi:hypothetical protein
MKDNDTKTGRPVWNVNNYQHSSNAVYFFGMIGAAVYYVQQAEGFWRVVLGLLKAIVWPAFVVHDLLQYLG